MLSYGTPWSMICLDNETLTTKFHERSRGALMQVYWYKTPTDRMHTFIYENLPRISLLRGKLQVGVDGWPTWLRYGAGPALQNVCLESCGDLSSDQVVPEFFAGGLPMLRTINLKGMRPTYTNVNLYNLISLSVDSADLGRIVDGDGTLLDLLKASPFLEELSISSDMDWFLPASPVPLRHRIHLVHLRKLMLTLCVPFAAMLLGSIRLPDDIEDLHIRTLPPLGVSPSESPFDFLGPEYLPEAYLADLIELKLVPHNNNEPAHCLSVFNKRLEYKKTKAVRTMPSLTIKFGQTAAEDLTTTMMKIRTSDVTRLRVTPYTRDWPTTPIEIMPIISRLPALTSLELICPRLPVHWDVASLLRALFHINPTKNDLDDGFVSSLATPCPHQIPNIREITIRVHICGRLGCRNLPFKARNLVTSPLWAADVLDLLAAFCRQFPTLLRLTLASCVRGLSPGSLEEEKMRVQTELERLGVDPQVYVRLKTPDAATR